jgi:NAD(P)-dependent dehydrogenase (short-subunit alcohol dehydrogenase family)
VGQGRVRAVAEMKGLLRDGLLSGTTVLTAPATPRADACRALGAEVRALEADLLDEAAVEAAAGPCDVLVVDGAALFGDGGDDALRRALDGAWCAVRATANAAFIPDERGGKVVLLAPRVGAGVAAEGLRAGLENLARVTSIEWSRYGITPTALLPGPATTDDELGDLVAYLASPAGDYFAGCAFALQ